MRSIGIWKPIDRKFGLRPWKCKNITTRCGLMLSLGMGLPRKITGHGALPTGPCNLTFGTLEAIILVKICERGL